MSPTNPQPGPSQPLPPGIEYGSLGTKDPSFFLTRLSNAQLYTIIGTAPESTRKPLPSNASKIQLLGEVLRLRDFELSAALEASNEHAKQLDTLLNTNPTDILKISKEEPHRLKSFMQSALVSDPTLRPASVPDSQSEAAAVSITWQFSVFPKSIPSSHLEASPPQQQQPQLPANQTLSQLIASASTVPPNQNEAHINTSDEDDEPPRKKIKQIIKPKGFTVGLSSAQLQGLANYQGKGVSSTSLMVDALIGPSILLSLIAAGSDIPTFLSPSFRHWRRMPSGQPSAAEVEA